MSDRRRLGSTLDFYRALAARSGPIGVLTYVYRQVLVRSVHAQVIDRLIMREEPAIVRRHVPVERLGLGTVAATDAVKYEPTPLALVSWAHRVLPVDVDGWTFLDLGAGRGRTLVAALRRPYRAVVGVELSDQLVAEGREMIAALAPAVVGGRSVELVHADATDFDPPDEPMVVMLFNPFGGDVLRRVVDGLAARAKQRFVVIYVNPQHSIVLRSHPAYRPLPVSWRHRVALAVLAPYDVEFYDVDPSAG